MSIRTLVLAAAGLALIPAAPFAANMSHETQSQKGEWSVDRHQAEKNLKSEIHQLRMKIDDLGRSGKAGSKDTAHRLNKRVDVLEGRLHELRVSSGDRWDKTRDSIQSEYDKISDDVHSFYERHRK